MAIETVNARYEGFIFDGQNSRNYGVYVTDVEVFGAPVRNVEMIQIPGRNGSYALDNGFYENIQVTYKCAMGCESQADFNAGISAFRNMLASRIGYKRLEDEINTDEYRMACFHGGISVPTLNKDTATFDVVFDCKPQRFLKSGETAVTIGGQVTNTQTESGAVVSIEGTGADKVTSLVAQIEPVQAGSGDPSPTNVRPITGHTSANVTVAGKNLFDSARFLDAVNWTESGGVYTGNSDRIASNKGGGLPYLFKFNEPISERLTLSLDATTNKTYRAGYLYFNYSDGTISYAEINTSTWKHFTMTSTNGKSVSYVSFSGSNSTTMSVKNVQLEVGASETDYEPYTGTTYPVSFGSAGTVYGGTVDVVTGALRVTHKMYTFDGSETISQYGSFAYGARFVTDALDSDAKNSQGLALTNRFGTGSTESHVTITSGSGKTNLWIKTGDLGSGIALNVTNLKSWLASNNLQVVYELATPQTYNLTAQQVELLTGENHVRADTGDITITWGDDPNKLVNPTLYDAHPLLSFTASGAGTININNDTISVTNQPIGDIVLANVVKLESGESVTWTDTSRYLTGDAIRIDSIPAIQTTVVMDSYSYANYTSYSGDDMDYLSTTATSRGMLVTHSIPTPPQYVAGTAKSDTYSATVINKVKHKTTGGIVDCTINLTVVIAYDGANNITATNTVTTSIGTASTAVTINTVIVNSTKSSLGGTAYIDLDIGEAYSIDGGAVVSINDSVSIGAALPVLGVGSNTVSKTGSVANLKVTPRWWQL